MPSLNYALKEVNKYGYYTCNCGNYVEPDGDCCCGLPNPIKEAGFI